MYVLALISSRQVCTHVESSPGSMVQTSTIVRLWEGSWKDQGLDASRHSKIPGVPHELANYRLHWLSRAPQHRHPLWCIGQSQSSNLPSDTASKRAFLVFSNSPMESFGGLPFQGVHCITNLRCTCQKAPAHHPSVLSLWVLASLSEAGMVSTQF